MLASPDLDAYVIPPAEQRRRAAEVRRIFGPRPAAPKPLTYLELVRLTTPARPPREPVFERKERPILADASFPTMAEIAGVVTAATGFTMTDLKSERRPKDLAEARHILVWLCREMMLASLPRIGRFLGGRDHKTILHAIRKIRARLETDAELRAEVASLEDEVRAVVARRREAIAGEGAV